MYSIIYRGNPWGPSAEVTLETLDDCPTWKPYMIGVLKSSSVKKQGFINIYPSTERGAKGLSYRSEAGVDVRTGDGIFTTRERADSFALPSRIAVATFEYEE